MVFVVSCAHVDPPPAPSGPLVGFATLTTNDPATGQPMRVSLFFPPAQPLEGLPVQRGPWWVDALDATPAAGAHPLIVISHGHGGSRFGHHDLATALARAGFVVAAPEHLGDTAGDVSGVGTARVLFGRAWQVRATVDAVLADSRFASVVDPQRIGVAGFSAGGYTSLLTVGAQPDFTLLTGYCQRHPKDAELCAGPRQLDVASPAQPTKDTRVKAAFVMAPLGAFFGPNAFDSVTAPVHLAFATADEVLLPTENALPVRDGLKTLEGVEEVAGAGHFVFLAPCPPAFASEAPPLCRDPKGVDRIATHAQLATSAVRFFETTLR